MFKQDSTDSRASHNVLPSSPRRRLTVGFLRAGVRSAITPLRNQRGNPQESQSQIGPQTSANRQSGFCFAPGLDLDNDFLLAQFEKPIFFLFSSNSKQAPQAISYTVQIRHDAFLAHHESNQ